MVQWLGFHALSAVGLMGSILFLVEELRSHKLCRVARKKKKKKRKTITTTKNPIQNGSTLGSVLTKAVHVVINTPNFFLSFDGKQKIEFIRISTGHKYVNSKTNQEAECVWILGFYA